MFRDAYQGFVPVLSGHHSVFPHDHSQILNQNTIFNTWNGSFQYPYNCSPVVHHPLEQIQRVPEAKGSRALNIVDPVTKKNIDLPSLANSSSNATRQTKSLIKFDLLGKKAPPSNSADDKKQIVTDGLTPSIPENTSSLVTSSDSYASFPAAIDQTPASSQSPVADSTISISIPLHSVDFRSAPEQSVEQGLPHSYQTITESAGKNVDVSPAPEPPPGLLEPPSYSQSNDILPEIKPDDISCEIICNELISEKIVTPELSTSSFTSEAFKHNGTNDKEADDRHHLVKDPICEPPRTQDPRPRQRSSKPPNLESKSIKPLDGIHAVTAKDTFPHFQLIEETSESGSECDMRGKRPHGKNLIRESARHTDNSVRNKSSRPVRLKSSFSLDPSQDSEANSSVASVKVDATACTTRDSLKSSDRPQPNLAKTFQPQTHSEDDSVEIKKPHLKDSDQEVVQSVSDLDQEPKLEPIRGRKMYSR
ncbi:unnamed protein product, partial [Protopolystoma xenopodis]